MPKLRADLKKKGFIITGGGGGMAEEYIRGAGPGTLGGTYVDITAVNEETGATIRVQTIDTLANGSPTPRETAAAERIRRAFPNDTLVLIPKRSAQ
jgi:filamentous hemagglutinin